MMSMRVPVSAFSKITRLEAPGVKSACLIMLHGLSGSAEGWTEEVKTFQMMLPHMSAILPTAIERPVTMLNGKKTTSWHDIHSLHEIDVRKCDGLPQSHESITDLIFEEIQAGTPSDRILVAGFSQGAAMALYASYQLSVKLAGVVALSGYLPNYDEFHYFMDDKSRPTPALICHGTKDETVMFEAGRKAADVLEANRVPVSFKSYEGMGHESCPQEILDVSSFIFDHLPN